MKNRNGLNFNNIKNLSSIFIRDNNNYLKLFNKNKSINRKSILFWILIILIFAISYLSYEIMKFLIKVNKPEIFINSYFLFLEILIIMQTIMLCTNIFYFSKDIENILPLPIKPIEILISKFNTILFMIYNTEFLFGLIPLLIYGFFINAKMIFFIKLILGLIIFPIFPILLVSALMMLIMQITKIFKNKDILQLIISLILISIIMLGMFFVFKDIVNNNQIDDEKVQTVIDSINMKILNINKYFVTINTTINIIIDNNMVLFLKNILYLFVSIFLILMLFIISGNKLYLKQLLKASFYTKIIKKKEIDLNKKIKNNSINKTIIIKEFKLLLKNPLFFIQCIYPVIILLITFSILFSALMPKIMELLNTEEYVEIMQDMKFDIEAVCIIIGLTQIINLFNYTSITAFSRDGKDAYIIKYLPIELYKQFVFKNSPQIFLNSMISTCLLSLIFYKIPAIGLKYFIPILIISILFNSVNSYILSFIDLQMPKLKWDSEYEILKNNKNKLLQYVLIVLNIMVLILIKNIFIDSNLYLIEVLFIIIVFLFLIFILINLLIKKYSNKLFKNIN